MFSVQFTNFTKRGNKHWIFVEVSRHKPSFSVLNWPFFLGWTSSCWQSKNVPYQKPWQVQGWHWLDCWGNNLRHWTKSELAHSHNHKNKNPSNAEKKLYCCQCSGTRQDSQLPLFFKQFQWQFNEAMYNASKVPMVNPLLKNLTKYFT